MRKIALIAAGFMAAAVPASAATVTFTLDNTVEGGAPTGFPVLTFVDTGMDMVRLTIDAAGLSGGEFISGVFFNFDGAPSPITFTFNAGLSAGGPQAQSISQTSNGRDTPGNQGLYDIELAFSTSNAMNGANRFNADETVVYDLTAVGLDALDFNVISAPEGPNNGQNFALARVQGIATGPGSASVADSDGRDEDIVVDPVPAPAALGLFGLGLLALSVRRRAV